MDRDDGVGAIVLATEHLLDLGAFHLTLEIVQRRLQIGAHVFALLRPFEQDTKVVDLLDQRIAQLEILGNAAPPLQRFLRLGLVFPEIRSGDAGLELGQLADGMRRVKDSSADLERVSRDLRSGEPDPQGRATRNLLGK
jgi:hypothetical protein